MRITHMIWLIIVVSGCSTTHQDLKAPYEIDPMIPVLDQWDKKESDRE